MCADLVQENVRTPLDYFLAHYYSSIYTLYLSDPERLIDVYNAVEHTNYPPDTPVEINTLTDVLYKNHINDLSFVLELSDSYVIQQEKPQLELKVSIYNINYEVNAEIVQKSRSLNEYSRFIGQIKRNLSDGLSLDESIKQAIEYGIEHDIMKEFLEQNGSEVHNMLLESWNMDEALAVSKEEGYEDGFEAGEKREREELIRKFSAICTPEQIAEILQTSKEYVLDVLNQDICVCEPRAEYKVSK